MEQAQQLAEIDANSRGVQAKLAVKSGGAPASKPAPALKGPKPTGQSKQGQNNKGA